MTGNQHTRDQLYNETAEKRNATEEQSCEPDQGSLTTPFSDSPNRVHTAPRTWPWGRRYRHQHCQSSVFNNDGIE